MKNGLTAESAHAACVSLPPLSLPRHQRATRPSPSPCVRRALPQAFPRNCLSLMTVSGAKGSLVNFSQISALLGQQELEGRRVPRMSSGKTLPCFGEYDAGVRIGVDASAACVCPACPQGRRGHALGSTTQVCR